MTWCLRINSMTCHTECMKNKTLFLFFMLTACAGVPAKHRSTVGENKASSVKQKNEAADSVDRDLAMVLQKKAQLDIQNPSLSAMSEVELLKSLSEARDRQDVVGFNKRYDVFMQRFPTGALAGDAVYLAGLLELSQKNYGKALKYFSMVQKLYPYNHRASSSLYFKAVTLKKMNLATQAASAYSLVVRKYPGSPEALRAQNELKYLNK